MQTKDKETKNVVFFQHGGATGGYDMNVIKAWERGYTGKGVVVTILDDGIEHTHPDLKANYVSIEEKNVKKKHIFLLLNIVYFM